MKRERECDVSDKIEGNKRERERERQRQRERLKRKRQKEIAAPAPGQVCDWLSPIVPTRFSQDSHLDPRRFRRHSLQLGRVFDSGSRVLDNAIIFCA